mmetsp:Transcript_49764/g.107790  ORF Transcript_49764/g.107790 Transcript_49764/m.107790 type:complete len:313 (+) Transcript_49764:416-1354(+)
MTRSGLPAHLRSYWTSDSSVSALLRTASVCHCGSDSRKSVFAFTCPIWHRTTTGLLIPQSSHPSTLDPLTLRGLTLSVPLLRAECTLPRAAPCGTCSSGSRPRCCGRPPAPHPHSTSKRSVCAPCSSAGWPYPIWTWRQRMRATWRGSNMRMLRVSKVLRQCGRRRRRRSKRPLQQCNSDGGRRCASPRLNVRPARRTRGPLTEAASGRRGSSTLSSRATGTRGARGCSTSGCSRRGCRPTPRRRSVTSHGSGADTSASSATVCPAPSSKGRCALAPFASARPTRRCASVGCARSKRRAPPPPPSRPSLSTR